MLWHIELKFCTWLCFNVLQIKFECHHFVSLWLADTFPTLWTEYDETWQEAYTQRPQPSWFFEPMGNINGHPGLRLADAFSLMCPFSANVCIVRLNGVFQVLCIVERIVLVNLYESGLYWYYLCFTVIESINLYYIVFFEKLYHKVHIKLWIENQAEFIRVYQLMRASFYCHYCFSLKINSKQF